MLTTNQLLQDRYRIIRQLGQGGMGTVYEAEDERLDTRVALKECHFTDEQLRKQFQREARLLAKMRHPAMTRVIDHFQENDGQFLVMDYIAGEDLSAALEREAGPLPHPKVLTWADQLLDVLAYLHSQEPPVIHRDIKPQNLKLTSRDQIMLLDFGLAKGFAGQLSRVTTSGSIFGYTPNYAPLEQIQGTGTDPRSDLYSLAATLYHLLTGAVPPDVLTRLTATTDGQPDPLRPAHEINNRVPAEIANILVRSMSIGRNQRFATANEMRQALDEAGNQERIKVEEVSKAPPLASTIINGSPTSAAKAMSEPLIPTLNARPLREEVTAIKVPPPIYDESVAVQEAVGSDWIPSTTLFEEPVGHIDRFAITRKLGLFVLLLIGGLLVFLLISFVNR